MRSRQLSLFIKLLILALGGTHMLLYIYEVPEIACTVCGFEPCNPKGWMQRVTIYIIVFLIGQLYILDTESMNNINIMYVLCSVMLGLTYNEWMKQNQDWGVWQFIGLVGCLVFPFIEKRLIKHIDLIK